MLFPRLSFLSAQRSVCCLLNEWDDGVEDFQNSFLCTAAEVDRGGNILLKTRSVVQTDKQKDIQLQKFSCQEISPSNKKSIRDRRIAEI